jgi:undecaprenyl phosphate-alpha-L-ara4N flippase subunit ArnE
VLKNPYVLGGTLLLGSSFFIWLFILSWFKLGVVFPLTAVTYILVALLAYFILDEKLSWYNYLGILLISGGIFFLLYK